MAEKGLMESPIFEIFVRFQLLHSPQRFSKSLEEKSHFVDDKKTVPARLGPLFQEKCLVIAL